MIPFNHVHISIKKDPTTCSFAFKWSILLVYLLSRPASSLNGQLLGVSALLSHNLYVSFSFDS